MIVYGTSVSPFVRKVLVFLAEKGLSAEHRPVGFHDPSPAFKAASPTGKIPGFSDGSYNLADSSAICQYLERKHPQPPLYPHTAEELGRAIWFDEYADTVIFGAFGKVFFNLFVVPRLHGREGDMQIVKRALEEEAPPVLAYLESQITGPFLVGDQLSIAGLAVASPFVNMRIVKHPVDPVAYPKLAGYVDAILARPSFAAAKDARPASS
jgi:glutathione S-transferase